HSGPPRPTGRRSRRSPAPPLFGLSPPSFLLQPPLDPLDRSARRFALRLQPRQSLGDQPLLIDPLFQRGDPRRRPAGPDQSADGLHQKRRDQGDRHPLPIHHPHTFLPPLHGRVAEPQAKPGGGGLAIQPPPDRSYRSLLPHPRHPAPLVLG